MTDAGSLRVEDHPLLRIRAFETSFGRPLGEVVPPDGLRRLLQTQADAPLERNEEHRKAVRDMLRYGGYKPTGRGKPASEYLVRIAQEGGLASINPAVDACNAVSLHSGIPISVVDLHRAEAPERIERASQGQSYAFNSSGQVIDLAGLLCLFDRVGPCANPVRDSQRTKTDESTTRTLSVLWGVAGHEPRLDTAFDWYLKLIDSLGASADPLRTMPLTGT